jgi:hypothetical protein
VDYTKKRHVIKSFTNLGRDRRWSYQSPSSWQIFINQVLIHDQFDISCEGVVDAANVTIQKINIVLKKIAGPNEFAENEQWSVICMKEKFHPTFATIY